ncbi:hypothetical protein K9N68_23725 [Kovacikia minuta CCNUW1]|uniref:hypothetical protein n=1 Tax=Kovacikia minuta TaxID=2931930 RepID=UPI001CCF6C6F|nr:hypothetical protein [Kovacikia minuta]UBF24660.1 hypothetical protein K9N68_23725 [Kovacikia minuta CCNUW1]
MEHPFEIIFPNGSTAEVIQLHSSADLDFILQKLGIDDQRPAMVVIGGASKLSEADFNRVRQLFAKVLAPLAQKWRAAVVDGGTDAGVMRLMGQARMEIGADFPLVGVIPIGLATLPNQTAPSPEAAPLEANHTHFVLVPGSRWGDESMWIASIASAIADATASVTVLVNGGEVAWRDASESVEADRSLIVVAGSGRTADILAKAVRGQSTDQRADEIVSSGLVQAIDLEAGASAFAIMIEEIFAAR